MSHKIVRQDGVLFCELCGVEKGDEAFTADCTKPQASQGGRGRGDGGGGSFQINSRCCVTVANDNGWANGVLIKYKSFDFVVTAQHHLRGGGNTKVASLQEQEIVVASEQAFKFHADKDIACLAISPTDEWDLPTGMQPADLDLMESPMGQSVKTLGVLVSKSPDCQQQQHQQFLFGGRIVMVGADFEVSQIVSRPGMSGAALRTSHGVVGIMLGVQAHNDFGSHRLEGGWYTAAQLGYMFTDSLVSLHKNDTTSLAAKATDVQALLDTACEEFARN